MACPSNPPPPAGYRVYRGNVPTGLVQWAIDLRDHINAFPYGYEWEAPDGTRARKDYHTFTYRNGELVRGICIPGITLYQPIPANAVMAASQADVNDNPGPDVAAYGADDLPDATDWGLVAIGAVAALAVAGGFYLGMRKVRR